MIQDNQGREAKAPLNQREALARNRVTSRADLMRVTKEIAEKIAL
jgi:hypothetical protein